jgi:hypothetical protein
VAEQTKLACTSAVTARAAAVPTGTAVAAITEQRQEPRVSAVATRCADPADTAGSAVAEEQPASAAVTSDLSRGAGPASTAVADQQTGVAAISARAGRTISPVGDEDIDDRDLPRDSNSAVQRLIQAGTN